MVIRKQRFSFLEELSVERSSLMGISILWIMLFHSGIPASNNMFLRVLWNIFVSFGGGVGVNLFFILSGFGLFYSVANNTDQRMINWKEWFLKRFIRLIPSYLVVSVIYYAMKRELSLYNLLQFNFWIDGVRDFWFIPGIVVCYCLFPFIYVSARKYGFGKVTLLLMILVVAFNLLFELFSTHYDKIEIFTWRIPCFVMGVCIGWLSKEQPHFKWGIAWMFLAVLFAVSFYVSNLSRPTFVLGTFLFLPVLTVLVYLLKRITPIRASLDYLGTRSLQLYLLHVSLVPLIFSRFFTGWGYLFFYFTTAVLFGEVLYRLASIFQTKTLSVLTSKQK